MQAIAHKKYRNKVSIIASILSTAKYGARKTRIMVRSNLNNEQFDDYMLLLEDRDLIHKNIDKRDMSCFFQTTPRGFVFLRTYDRLAQLTEQSLREDFTEPPWSK